MDILQFWFVFMPGIVGGFLCGWWLRWWFVNRNLDALFESGILVVNKHGRELEKAINDLFQL
jgi:hypothetical protein